MTAIAEVREIPTLIPEQTWPLGVFVKEPPMEVILDGLTGNQLEVKNWHAGQSSNLSDERWQRLAKVGRTPGGLFNYGHLDLNVDPVIQIDQLNDAVQAEGSIFAALRRSDVGGPLNHEFVMVGLAGFVLRDSLAQPGVKRAGLVALTRDGQKAMPRYVHNAWLFY